MIKKTIKLLRNQKGYGTVELLILVAALGLLAVTVTGAVSGKLTSDDSGSATNKINSTITDLLDQASGE